MFRFLPDKLFFAEQYQLLNYFLAKKGRNRIFGSGGDCNPFVAARCKILRKAKVKSLWITVVIVSTFIVCWTPYYVSMVVSVFLDTDDQVSQGLHEFIFFFGSSTAVLNPLIYGAFHLRKGAPLPPISNGTSSRGGDTSWAMSTFRRMKFMNGKASVSLVTHSSRRNTQRLHVADVF
ncbi:hypothetical protein JTE90_018962 [Oedothorax gibbosus]|uniref:G-protein coupled receptors family 1 profile domain-containing protein n=1 Tax=Oedothorax gibbosus TaxID=931172 RepID=A0AAV6UZ42_9ARAC|nr:hypothetical protein JTE90_018962 [Oedothorax gibbosus]